MRLNLIASLIQRHSKCAVEGDIVLVDTKGHLRKSEISSCIVNDYAEELSQVLLIGKAACDDNVIDTARTVVISRIHGKGA